MLTQKLLPLTISELLNQVEIIPLNSKAFPLNQEVIEIIKDPSTFDITKINIVINNIDNTYRLLDGHSTLEGLKVGQQDLEGQFPPLTLHGLPCKVITIPIEEEIIWIIETNTNRRNLSPEAKHKARSATRLAKLKLGLEYGASKQHGGNRKSSPSEKSVGGLNNFPPLDPDSYIPTLSGGNRSEENGNTQIDTLVENRSNKEYNSLISLSDRQKREYNLIGTKLIQLGELTATLDLDVDFIQEWSEGNFREETINSLVEYFKQDSTQIKEFFEKYYIKDSEISLDKANTSSLDEAWSNKIREDNKPSIDKLPQVTRDQVLEAISSIQANIDAHTHQWNASITSKNEDYAECIYYCFREQLLSVPQILEIADTYSSQCPIITRSFIKQIDSPTTARSYSEYTKACEKSIQSKSNRYNKISTPKPSLPKEESSSPLPIVEKTWADKIFNPNIPIPNYIINLPPDSKYKSKLPHATPHILLNEWIERIEQIEQHPSAKNEQHSLLGEQQEAVVKVVEDNKDKLLELQVNKDAAKVQLNFLLDRFTKAANLQYEHSSEELHTMFSKYIKDLQEIIKTLN